MEIIKTDVLVIGGGGAGMQAALAAKEKGAKVLLISKTPIGKTTCTYMSGGAFAVAAEGFSREEHLKNTLDTGKGLNVRKLVEILVEETPQRIKGLTNMGLAGEWRKGRFYVLGKAPSWGAPLANFLASSVQRQGIGILPWVIVFDLVVENDNVIGALGFDFHKGKVIAVQSKTVLLANGGGGALFGRHDNPVRITGDGYALAFQAGCRLRDMEFVQFMPPGLAEPGRPTILIAAALSDYGRVINSAGENVLEKYRITEKPVAVRSRDSFSLAIFREEAEGREVYLDLTSLSEKDWPKDNMSWSQRETLIKTFSAYQKPLRISPMCHFFMGGVAADIDGFTGIPGLFAAGEVMGGVHGANRMGGNALGEILVFGYRAGKAAAHWAETQKENEKNELLLRDREKTFSEKMKKAGGNLSPRTIRRNIGKILWEKAGISRDKKGLNSALESLRKIREETLLEMRRQTHKEILEGIEVENALLVGEIIIRGALMREESRGAHYRTDFPKMDDPKWKGNIFLRKEGEGMHLEFLPLWTDQ